MKCKPSLEKGIHQVWSKTLPAFLVSQCFALPSFWKGSSKRFQVCLTGDDVGRKAGRGAASIKVIMVRCVIVNMNRNRNTGAEVMPLSMIRVTVRYWEFGINPSIHQSINPSIHSCATGHSIPPHYHGLHHGQKRAGFFSHSLYMTLVKYYCPDQINQFLSPIYLVCVPFSPSNLLGTSTVYPKKTFIPKHNESRQTHLGWPSEGSSTFRLQKSKVRILSQTPLHKTYHRPKYTHDSFFCIGTDHSTLPRPSLLATIYRNPGIRLDELPICTLDSLLLLPLLLLIFIRA
jgi:hypothetical protein